MLAVAGERAAIVIDPSLDQVDRNAALAHELIHLERGGGAEHGGMPDDWEAVVARDEAAVDAEVARRLCPLEELIPWAARRVAAGETVEAWQVAEEWGIPERIARLAIRAAGAGVVLERLEAAIAALDDEP
jgi:hypothetical protein